MNAAASLLVFLRPDESAADFLARTYVEPLLTGVPLIDNHLTFRPGQLLEVAGPAGSGKTDVLTQAAATCILPEQLEGIKYNGHTSHVLWFDLDSKFDILRLHQVLDSKAQTALAAAGIRDQALCASRAEAVVADSLSRLHVARCHSSFQFLAALKVIRPTLQALKSSGRVAALLIDNIAACYYIDRAARGAAASSGPGAASGAAAALSLLQLLEPRQPGEAPLQQGDITREGAPLSLWRVHAAVAADLRALQQEFRLPIIATKHALLSSRDAERPDAWDHREFMPKPWLDLVTHRLLLKRMPLSAVESHQACAGGQQQAGGIAAAGGGGGCAAEVHLARWQQPDEGPAMRFVITDGGIHLH